MSKKQLTIVELRDKIGLLNTEKQGIFDKMKAEGRKADENEEKRLAEIVTDIADCEFEIKLAEARNKQRPVANTQHSRGGLLAKAIRSKITGETCDEWRG